MRLWGWGWNALLTQAEIPLESGTCALQARLRQPISTPGFDRSHRLAAPEGIVELAVPNRMFAAWVEENFLDELASAWVEAAGRKARFAFRWDDGAAQGELFREPVRRAELDEQGTLFRGGD